MELTLIAGRYSSRLQATTFIKSISQWARLKVVNLGGITRDQLPLHFYQTLHSEVKVRNRLMNPYQDSPPIYHPHPMYYTMLTKPISEVSN